jgi:hypothetical protein
MSQGKMIKWMVKDAVMSSVIEASVFANIAKIIIFTPTVYCTLRDPQTHKGYSQPGHKQT